MYYSNTKPAWRKDKQKENIVHNLTSVSLKKEGIARNDIDSNKQYHALRRQPMFIVCVRKGNGELQL